MIVKIQAKGKVGKDQNLSFFAKEKGELTWKRPGVVITR